MLFILPCRTTGGPALPSHSADGIRTPEHCASSQSSDLHISHSTIQARTGSRLCFSISQWELYWHLGEEKEGERGLGSGNSLYREIPGNEAWVACPHHHPLPIAHIQSLCQYTFPDVPLGKRNAVKKLYKKKSVSNKPQVSRIAEREELKNQDTMGPEYMEASCNELSFQVQAFCIPKSPRNYLIWSLR